MLGIARLAVVMMVVLSIFYVFLFLYLRSGIKMRLEEEWVMEGRPGEREDWVDTRLAPKAARLHGWLIVIVYVLPIMSLGAFVFLTN